MSDPPHEDFNIIDNSARPLEVIQRAANVASINHELFAGAASNGLPRGIQAVQHLGEIALSADKFLLPAAVLVDGARFGNGIYSDVTHGTSRNHITTGASIAGGWGGGIGDAYGGDALGTAISPGVGTLIGGIAGGIAGGVAASLVGEAAVDAVGDYAEWDMKILTCTKCGQRYECRMYTDQSREYCPRCSSK